MRVHSAQKCTNYTFYNLCIVQTTCVYKMEKSEFKKAFDTYIKRENVN